MQQRERSSESLSIGRVITEVPAAQVMQGLLFDVRKYLENPAAGLLPADSEVRQSRPTLTPTAARQLPMRTFKTDYPQAQLLQVVRTL